MYSNTTLKFTIRQPGGDEKTLSVDSERALLGSGSHCEVKLPPEHAEYEHVLVEKRSGGIFAEARSSDPEPLLNGVPLTEGKLLPDSVLALGALDISVEVGSQRGQASAEKGAREKPPPTTVAGLVLLVLGGAYVVYNNRSESTQLERPAAPELWAEEYKSECPHQMAEQGRALAADEMLLAEGKRERAPFYPEDGVEAVAHFRRAAACFEVADVPKGAKAALRAADQLQERLAEDYHIHQVRLERALALKEYEDAHNEVSILLAFLAAHPGDYVNWLSNIERRLELKFVSKSKKK